MQLLFDPRETSYAALCEEINARPGQWADFVPVVIGATGVVTPAVALGLRRVGLPVPLPWPEWPMRL